MLHPRHSRLKLALGCSLFALAASLSAARAADPITLKSLLAEMVDRQALTQFPETSAVLSAAETTLDFKTKAARDIEAARIKSVIDPRLADHVRREAVKFVDELQRAV